MVLQSLNREVLDYRTRADAFAVVYQEAIRRMSKALERRPMTKNMRQYLQARQRVLKRELALLQRDGVKWLRRNLNHAWDASTEDFSETFIRNGKPDPLRGSSWREANVSGLNRVLAAAETDFKDHIAAVATRTSQVMRRLQLDATAQAKAAGWTVRDLKKELHERMTEAGLVGEDAKVRVGGRSMNVRSYTRMVARTAMANASHAATYLALDEIDHDLVQVIGSFGCALCRPWVGAVLSRGGDGEWNGQKLVPLQTAISAGLFHPNCVHDFSAFFPEFGTERQLKRAKKLTDDSVAFNAEYEKWKKDNPKAGRVPSEKNAIAIYNRAIPKEKREPLDAVSGRVIPKPEKAKPSIPQWKPAKTLEEAEQWAKKNGVPTIPKNAKEAAKAYTENLQAWRKLTARPWDTEPEGGYEQVEKSWLKELKHGKWDRLTDGDFLIVQNAMNKNHTNSVFRKMWDKAPADTVILVGDYLPNHSQSASAERIGGVTFVYKHEFWETEKWDTRKGEKPKPGSSDWRSWESDLRHEFGHSVSQEMSPEKKEEWSNIYHNAKSSEWKDGLTWYAGKNPNEGFSEAFALATEPQYEPNDFPKFVRDACEFTLNAWSDWK